MSMSPGTVSVNGQVVGEIKEFYFNHENFRRATVIPLLFAIKREHARRYPEFPFMPNPVARIVRDLNSGRKTLTLEERARAMGIIP